MSNTTHNTTRLTKTSPVLSFVEGSQTPALWNLTLGALVDKHAAHFGGKAAATFPWQNHKLSYNELAKRSRLLAKSMLSTGLQHDDCIAIMAGNCFQYIEAFVAAARIGCPFVVLNNTYSAKELTTALATTSCKLLFIASNIGKKDLSQHIAAVVNDTTLSSHLKTLVSLSDRQLHTVQHISSKRYSEFAWEGRLQNDAVLQQAESLVSPEDVLNLQFTSGTTGTPKAAMLTHLNLINNGRLVGAALHLDANDKLCCPPPLFHCFGLVMGFLGAFTHGSTIVFPCDQFEPDLVLDAIVREKCTVLYGVPTMFIAELEANKTKQYKINSVRTGLAAGSSVPVALMRQLSHGFGVKNMMIAYGMTETSPVTFITSFSDPEEKRIKTVGKVMPHTAAKVVDREGNIVKRGSPGELCTSGYALQKGYWRNQAKTDEAMKRDEQGQLWMLTGDECVIDDEGYCRVTGRIKDIIIRGGENIFPAEIEDRLLEHSHIAEASVVAIKDDKYGEVVGAFLKATDEAEAARPSLQEIKDWTGKTLGSHKAPSYVFWSGQEGFVDFPKTGSWKHQKYILRDIGNCIVNTRKRAPQAKL